MKKMGRPPLHNETKGKRFEIRLNPKQYETLEKLSEIYGKSKAETVILALEELMKKERRKEKRKTTDKNCVEM